MDRSAGVMGLWPLPFFSMVTLERGNDQNDQRGGAGAIKFSCRIQGGGVPGSGKNILMPVFPCATMLLE